MHLNHLISLVSIQSIH